MQHDHTNQTTNNKQHQQASKEEYDSRMKELEGICQPIISKMYQSSGAAAAEGVPTASDPHVEEVD